MIVLPTSKIYPLPPLQINVRILLLYHLISQPWLQHPLKISCINTGFTFHLTCSITQLFTSTHRLHHLPYKSRLPSSSTSSISSAKASHSNSSTSLFSESTSTSSWPRAPRIV